jgi:hypothetical protein
MYNNIMEKWGWGGMDNVEEGIYMDENNRRMVTNIRLQMANLAEALIAEGRGEMALATLEKVIDVTPQENVPYTRVMLPIQENLALLATADSMKSPLGEDWSPELRERATERLREVTLALFAQQESEIDYYLSLEPGFYNAVRGEKDVAIQVADRLKRITEFYLPDDPELSALGARLDSIRSKIDAKDKAIIDLGRFSF